MPADLQRLQFKIDYQFSDPELLRQALTHRSSDKLNNERLEFLGDAVLGLIIAEELCQRFPDASEGELSRMRANLVNRNTLAEIAKQLDLGSHLLLGAGERKSGGVLRASILSDAVEALLAAVYLDRGLSHCRSVIMRLYESRLDNIVAAGTPRDSKTRLQEILQARSLPVPMYEVDKISGEAHDQTFLVSCTVAMLKKPEAGRGKSKRFAEQDAAAKVLAKLGHNS